MLLVGLTGGIASGKSTVASMLADRGAVVLDADLIARQVVEPGEEAWRRIVEHFGNDVLLPDKSIDRTKLGAIVFADESKRSLLNEITHPRVMSVIADRLEELRPTASIVVADIPLLAEAGAGRGSFDLIVVVDAAKETQIDRLARDRAMDHADAQSRINAQAGSADRRALADIVIENDGDREALAEQVDALWTQLQERVSRIAGDS